MRDAANVDKAVALVLVGSRPLYMELDCGMCGAETCDLARAEDKNCIYPLVDLGIALGSGVSMAAEQGLDNRVMYSIGLAALRTGLFAADPGVRCAVGVPFKRHPQERVLRPQVAVPGTSGRSSGHREAKGRPGHSRPPIRARARRPRRPPCGPLVAGGRLAEV